MGKTSIEWTDWSINPIRARHKATGAIGHYCEKISAGCANCYASRLQSRFMMPPFGSGQRRDDVELFLDEKTLQQVLKRKKPTRIFWCDMTDLFGHWVPWRWIDRCLAVMALTPQHTHQVLTKRAYQMRHYFLSRRLIYGTDTEWFIQDEMQKLQPPSTKLSKQKKLILPIPNIHLGISAENQQELDSRAPHLKATPAALRFLSYEPALGPLDLSQWIGLCDCGRIEHGRCHEDCPSQSPSVFGWIIAGGESGPRAKIRPLKADWIRSARDQCQLAKVPFFFKQWGKHGSKDRLLDGRKWEEMPHVVA